MKITIKITFAAFFSATMMLFAGLAEAQTTKEEFLTKWENGKQFTLDVLDKMPEGELDFKPDPEAMSFKEQIHHIGESIVAISKGFLKGAEDAPTIELATASKADLVKFVAAAYDYGTATLKGLNDADAAEKIEVFGTTVVTRRQVEALLMDHCTHHRGSAIAYLRFKGIAPPGFVGF